MSEETTLTRGELNWLRLNTLDRLLKALPAHRYAYANERQLQDGIERVLTAAAVAFVREARMSRSDRPDFLIAPGIALEVKVDGSLSLVTRQLFRYAQLVDVHTIVLVTTRMQHRQFPAELDGKPVHVVHLIGSVL